MVQDSDKSKIEKALYTFASISLGADSPNLKNYYSEQTIQKLFKLANQLENNLSYLALDALR